MRTYKGLILKRSDIPDNGIFQFGSNTQGRHRKGAALVAMTCFGALYGQPIGPQGDSYAIVTKDLTKLEHPSIDVDYITFQIALFYEYAKAIRHKDFYIAYGIGPNLNGYSPEAMAAMYSTSPIPENMVFEEEFSKLLKLQE